MPLFSTDAKIFRKKKKKKKKLKKTPSKVARKYSNFLAAKTAQTEELMFQNVAKCI